jgi:menaquinone reductase, multiheme cytochrome c subunit
MRRVLLALPLTLLAATVPIAVSFREAVDTVRQPVGFDHARHAQEDLACIDCHKTAESAPYASLPRNATCRLCHEEAKGESVDEARVREYLEKGHEIPWVQVNRLPGHVYFSHAMHVKLGKMECSACHGDMAAATEPVTSSQIDRLTMGRCMDCHFERGASNDCLACHK